MCARFFGFVSVSFPDGLACELSTFAFGPTKACSNVCVWFCVFMFLLSFGTVRLMAAALIATSQQPLGLNICFAFIVCCRGGGEETKL